MAAVGSVEIQPLTFRRASLADVSAVGDLIASAYRGEESRRGWTTEAHLLGGPRIDADGIRRIIDAPDSYVLLAEAAGQLLGCCHVRAETPGQAYVGLLAVRPWLQGQGIGRAIIAWAEREAHERWATTQVRMQVIRQRRDLIAWYERLGYLPTGETLPFPYDAPGVVATRPDLEFVVLVKPIDGLAAAPTPE